MSATINLAPPESNFYKELSKLGTTLMTKYPNNFIIPCIGKAPIFKHKKNEEGEETYNWEYIQEPKNNVNFNEKTNVAIILKDLIVIDIDKDTYIPIFEERFPIMKTVVQESTTKGKHYYFKRTELCNTHEIYDTSRCLKLDGKKIDVDIKTITTTGTGGIIICSPSKNKEWIISINDKPLIDIPNEIVNYFKDNWHTNKPPTVEKKKALTKEDKQLIVEEFVNENHNINDKEINCTLLKELVSIIKQSNSIHYDDWIRVGWAIYNTTMGSNEGLEIFDDFSQGSDKYDKKTVDKYWSTMSSKPDQNKYTSASLRYWAKKENNESYELFLERSVDTYIMVSLRNNDYDIANMIYQYYKNEFIIFTTPDGKIKDCYRFHNHRWLNDGIITLKKNISTTIANLYTQEFIKYNNLKKECKDKEQAKIYNSIAVAYQNISHNLKMQSHIRSIIEILKTLMGESMSIFELYRDENKDLIGFNNGVYDIERNEFRDGRPDDYITMCTNIDYTDIEDTFVQKEVKELIYSSFENEELYNYLIDVMSYGLSGHKNLEMYMVLHGKEGRNGKSLLTYLLSQTFGDYYCEIKASNLTDPTENKGGTDSEIVQTRGKRFVVSTEPAKTAKLQINRMKEWTGNDQIKCRALYKDAIQFTPQFIIMILLNHAMTMSSYKDSANEKRMNVIDYPLTFVDEPNKPNERKIDRTLKQKITKNESYKQQFMLMLLNNLKKIYKNETFTINTPKIVKEATKKLLVNNNEFMLWFNDNFEITSEVDFIRKQNLFEIYKNDHSTIKKSTFHKYMEENGFSTKKLNGYDVYRGFKRIPAEYRICYDSDNESTETRILM